MDNGAWGGSGRYGLLHSHLGTGGCGLSSAPLAQQTHRSNSLGLVATGASGQGVYREGRELSIRT